MPRSRPLTPPRIAEAALAVGDREGGPAMTMRRIAAELGCDPMALYRHFADREALLDAVADLALADVTAPDPRAGWEERLRHVATAIREAALRHPGAAAHVAARPPLGPHGRRLGAAIFAALLDAGLPRPAAVRAAQALIAYVAAALAMAVRAGQRDARWSQVSQVISALPDSSPGSPPGSLSGSPPDSLPDSLPGEELPVVGSAEQFAYGLGLLLAGIRVEAEAARRNGP
ncbi:TetR/AcrR family transcriptional regulator C-terminal domain-containing protein [Micromonospora sp. WMMD1082]|uniref:TetR/AcrR family transcriptional regulator n=1 Tax=Micromonospora sp. WMMD1082 TaxID=3016104 RepID=UPI0024164C2B|nr:TetR/AcrR family transcriptional regulator C-terminal domain-containing protein [Micromonospora sp. WMMD1082]MDG4797415.1 TetR/AcrR family transcriptional regulator C-terminal domain-containing protein [Micromonospora sp. WMMD1082]